MPDFRGHDYKGYQLWDDDTAFKDALGHSLAVGDIVIAALQYGPGGVIQRPARVTGGNGIHPITIAVISTEMDSNRETAIRGTQLVFYSDAYRDTHPALLNEIFGVEVFKRD